MIKNYWKYDGLALGEMVRRGDVTALELLESALDAARKLNPKLNFICHDLEERGREAAANVDKSAPFAGVPFLLKDIGAQMKGTPYEAGSRILKGNISDHDSNLTARFHKAGLMTFAKTTTPEFGAQINTETILTGITRNPWNPDYTPGGSSGGGAAAVAAGVVPVAHANDGLGSIRIPASNSGLFGLKPTRQRTPAGPRQAEISGGRGVEFVVSRTVRDSAALLDAVQGPDVGAPHWAPPPARPYMDELTAKPQPLRIAVMTNTFTGAAVDPECARAVAETAKLCSDMGHMVEEAMPKVDWDAYMWAIRLAGTASMTAGLNGAGKALNRTPSPDNLEPLTWLTFLEGKDIMAFDYFRALDVYAALQRGMGAFFENYDILMTPVLSQPPAPIGWLGTPDDDLDIFWEKFAGDSYSPFAGIFNVTGHPAASLPLHMTPGGLPIGTQIVGRFGDEGAIFRLSRQLEEAMPWIDRLPPLHVANI